MKQINVEQHEIDDAFDPTGVTALAGNYFFNRKTTFPTLKNDFNSPPEFVKLKNFFCIALFLFDIGNIDTVV